MKWLKPEVELYLHLYMIGYIAIYNLKQTNIITITSTMAIIENIVFKSKMTTNVNVIVGNLINQYNQPGCYHLYQLPRQHKQRPTLWLVGHKYQLI